MDHEIMMKIQPQEIPLKIVGHLAINNIHLQELI